MNAVIAVVDDDADVLRALTRLLGGAGFTVQNPNAKKSCACGQSFDTGANAETAQKCS